MTCSGQHGTGKGCVRVAPEASGGATVNTGDAQGPVSWTECGRRCWGCERREYLC